jgi:hypothetical protein
LTIDLNLKPETFKLLEENIGKTLQGIDNYCPNRIPTALDIIVGTDKLDESNLKTSAQK